jgi:porphobilinogen synthase
MGFPLQRPRRLRQSEVWRRMVRETRLSGDALIYPLFLVPGKGVRRAVVSMPGICQLSVDEAVKEAQMAAAVGVPAIILFAAPTDKDGQASALVDPQGLVPTAIAAIKEACPALLVWVDVCLCGATDHGHCGHVLPSGKSSTQLCARRRRCRRAV